MYRTSTRVVVALVAYAGLAAPLWAQTIRTPPAFPRSPSGQPAYSVLYGNDGQALLATLVDPPPGTGYGIWLLPSPGSPVRLTPASDRVFLDDVRRASSSMLGTIEVASGNNVALYNSAAPSTGEPLVGPPGFNFGLSLLDASGTSLGFGPGYLATQAAPTPYQQLFAVPPTGGSPVEISPAGADVTQAAFNRGTSLVVFASGDASENSVLTQASRSSASLQPIPIPAGTDHTFPDVNQSPVCPTCVVYVQSNSTQTSADLILRDLATGNSMTLVVGNGTIPAWPAWSPDGRSLAYIRGDPVSGEAHLEIVRPPLPVPLPPPPPPPTTELSFPQFMSHPIAAVTWSPDSQRLAFLAQSSAAGEVVRVYETYVCYANCDSSTSVPVLNINDFVCFVNRFAAGDSYANCDGSTNPPILNVNDFVCFVNTFAAACP